MHPFRGYNRQSNGVAGALSGVWSTLSAYRENAVCECEPACWRVAVNASAGKRGAGDVSDGDPVVG